ncbi:sensor histidine kinase [Cellulomonas alba]|uniref:histidine kinase n=1 Tax=Cellulomonas alba TaxID=3053467 RepID=A0ABT7SHB9_9CELL|nr:HAMP domain-containing sensor histidine kinase [Cellulomonas alba]MDM7855439.1 HAMP domain-containing sensor histidine kinase [Cellulomonas alba]
MPTPTPATDRPVHVDAAAPQRRTPSGVAGVRRAGARLTDGWSRVPLVARLVGIISVLLAIGLVITSVAASTLLHRNLVAQLDSKLSTEGLALAQQIAASSSDPLRGSANLQTPSDYYVSLDTELWGQGAVYRRTVVEQYGTPNIPDLTVRQASRLKGKPFTVTSTMAGSHWRVAMFPATAGPQNTVVGSVAVALPLGGAQDTFQSMVLVLLLTGVAILVIGAVAGWWAVRRSLRSLHEIEDTAAAIAAGDLSRRVPSAPATTEVGRLGAALNTMLAQIEDAFDVRTASEARMRRFVADASHELRTPLATIRGYGELYRMGALTSKDQVDDTMRRIESSATRMGGLVEDLLALARLDEGRPLQLGPVDLTVLAADAVSDLHALDPSRTARLVPLTEGGSGGPFVVIGEEARLRQVLANLVGNVVQHTPEGTRVEIAVGSGEGPGGAPRGVVEVRDHGPGIDPEHAKRVFERFYRVDASRGRTSGGGAGLGMAIVAAIVSAHHGEVTLAQTPDGGTTVRVALPASPAS